MRWVAAVLLTMGLVAGTMTPAARAEDFDIKISVFGHDGKPLKGTAVDVFWWSSADGKEIHTNATTGDDGTVTVKVPDKHQIFAKVHDSSQLEQTGGGTSGPVYGRPPDGFTVNLRVDIDAEAKLVQDAVDKCDADGYDRHPANLDTGVADQQARVDDASKKAEAFATENNIPYGDLGSAEKALKASAKLAGTEAATKEAAARYRNLDTYVRMLRSLEDQKKVLDGYKKQRDAVPKRPACKSGAMVPNGCPTGGGLLAGGLNQLLGTDLPPGCPPPERRNDTRHNGGEGDSDRRRRD